MSGHFTGPRLLSNCWAEPGCKTRITSLPKAAEIVSELPARDVGSSTDSAAALVRVISPGAKSLFAYLDMHSKIQSSQPLTVSVEQANVELYRF